MRPFVSSYASTEQDTLPREQLSAHEVLCPGYYSHDLSNRDILLQKALFLSQFLRFFMIIDGVFLVLWALLAWPFFIGLLLIITGFYGVKYYNVALSSMYGVYLLANIALRIWWLTMAHALFDIVILSLGLAVTVHAASHSNVRLVAWPRYSHAPPPGLLAPLASAAQAYIFYLLCSFIWTASELSEEERLALVAFSAWDFGYSQPVIIAPIVVVPADTYGYYQRPLQRDPPAAAAANTSGTGQRPEGAPEEAHKAPSGPVSSPGASRAPNIIV